MPAAGLQVGGGPRLKAFIISVGRRAEIDAHSLSTLLFILLGKNPQTPLLILAGGPKVSVIPAGGPRVTSGAEVESVKPAAG